jgi:NAD+ synthase
MIDAFGTIPDFETSAYIVGNLMARIRMAVLYYYANAHDALVSGTSNKSEYLLGYCTKYGDNAADFQPILHLYKTEVYTMARELSLPDAIITKPPSAGLWHGQSDERELGFSYEEIDGALRSLEENGWKATSGTEHTILQRVQKNMHKRLAPPSLLTSSSSSR